MFYYLMFLTDYQMLEKNKQKEFLKTIIERKSGLKMNQTNEIREKSIRKYKEQCSTT